MMFKVGCFFVMLLVGSIAFPVNEEKDMSFFFDHPVDPFLIGGVKADPVPHMVALISGIITKSLLCGGSIVNERFVLTAAHCLENVQPGGILLRSLRGYIGSNRWSTGIQHRFSRLIIHPDYDRREIKNDIGFLVTSSTMDFTDNVQPVALNFDFIGANTAIIVNGWGIHVNGEPSSPVVLELRPFTVDGQRCVTEVARVAAEQNILLPSVDPEVELCTFLKPTTGTCSGDSGSALVLKENKQQIGIVSWGVGCAQGAPDMATRISAYQSWIEQQLQ